MSDPLNHPIDPEDAAELRRSLAESDSSADDRAAHAPPPDMSRDEALLRLADRLSPEAFASIHLAEVAIANRDVAADLRGGKPAKVWREWSILITAPGYSHNHAGDQLAPVVEQALADYLDWRAARDAQEWARTAIPDQPKPPKLVAPTSADQQQQKKRDDRGQGQRGAG
jgi:hypothetical protein